MKRTPDPSDLAARWAEVGERLKELERRVRIMRTDLDEILVFRNGRPGPTPEEESAGAPRRRRRRG